MYEWILAGLIVFVASMSQAAIGFGFAVVATPFLLLVFNSRDVIQMSIMLSFLIAVILTPKIKDEINDDMLKRLIIGSLLGIPVGLFFFAYVSLSVLKLTVSIVILALTFFLISRWYTAKGDSFAVGEEPAPFSSSFKKWLQEPEQRNEILVGLCAGTLTTSVGMPGVPLALYFAMNNTPKGTVRSTTLAFFIFVYILSMVIQALTVKISWPVVIASSYLIPAAIAGVYLGHILFDKIDQKMFQIITNGILVITGFYMLLKSF
ncbi:sulfite exporter TauE/SafE family protein [Desulforamulus aeronauticus]|uniref:Probable membrane transporter protein n=1 Tax=Desulforamulus aeronauticus DSM 10349 TaxID=1121421 RepID=A0A1M6RTG1_9FIRM|nr:sulfite exporter TauE/SafE family protein [Desulforamulus aeronauticus]SHK35822.1 Uncharacterized membrane protein YfcA [Desulforamulus aeronauticus DSM 10349]